MKSVGSSDLEKRGVGPEQQEGTGATNGSPHGTANATAAKEEET